jgi:hypothetical protein
VWLKRTGCCLLGLVLGSGCGRGVPEVTGPCNGSEDLCDRPYDRIAFATTHNAMSNADDNWVNPNQQHGIERQLGDGVRGLMLDLHYWEGQVMLCHGVCALGTTLIGMKPLGTALEEIGRFLNANPNEVLTILFESYVEAVDVEAAIEQAGLVGRVYSHHRGKPWPTLRKLLSAGKRLVVFTDDAAGAPGWYHPVWDYCWETSYDIQAVEQFSCAVNRGTRDNDLFILNHFISDPWASEDRAAEANAYDVLYPRAVQCFEESGSLPNFVTVDFYAVGDVLAVVEKLNE